MKIIELEQNSPEWLEFRRTKIGASDLPIILGVSPYCTPLILWKRKLGFEESPFMHAGMRYGHENESRVREMMQNSLKVRLDPVVVQHETYDWATASLDGYGEKDGTAIIAEIKCCKSEDHEMARAGKIPEKYIPQVQWQMFVSGAREAHYGSFHKEELIIVPVFYDESFVKDALQKASEFKTQLDEFEPPSHSEKDYVKITNQEFCFAALSWQNAKNTLDNAKEQEKFYRDILISCTDDGNCEGGGVRMTRIEQQGCIDWDKVCEKYKINKGDLDGFRKKQIGFWKISIIK